ncbi:hypothetical protein [Leptolyngbya ohadii]|uniref:hypothetical protein n=1 Tax=Leptolyngbya ohadii TaxID=1962290 RepID=UPI000B5A0CF0|nr:hypothetical protein [Leptolyngbya ohadii]
MVKFKPDFERRHPRVALIVAIVALINLGLVFFDLTYLGLRPVYQQYLPGVAQLYDPVKGVEVQPQTQAYRMQVDRLKDQLDDTGLISPQAEASLAELRTFSQEIVSDRAFVSPRGEEVLATIQQKIRERTGEPSAREGFDRFWSAEYLEQQGWEQELDFWDAQIAPFFAANYYRRVNVIGLPVNYFWLIDLPFVLIFAADIGSRILLIRRRNPELAWIDVVLREWYDLLLLVPFWRWLRVIPVSLRLYLVELLDLEPIRAQAQRDTIVTVGADLAGIVGIEIIEQLQESLRQGNLLELLSATADKAEQNGANNNSTNNDIDPQEAVAITDRLYDASVQHILPRIQPDLENLVQHSLTKTLEQMTGYPQLHHLPGLGRLSTQLVQQLSNSVVQNVYHGITGAITDTEGRQITDRLQHNLRKAIAEEFDQNHTLKEIQSRLDDVLEEFKSKYVKALAEAGGERLADRTEVLHRQIS